jgi:HK97 family phage portal protein
MDMSLRDRIETIARAVTADTDIQTLSIPAGEEKAAPYPANGGGGWVGWERVKGVPFEVVRAELSSIVMACMATITQVFPEAPIRVLRPEREGNATEAGGHPVTALVNRPNDFFSSFEVWASLLIDYCVEGNAYLWKGRNRYDQPVELWPLPAAQMQARWPRDGSVLVSHYDYLVGGKKIRLEAEDVIHFRNARKGLDWRPGRDGRYGRSQIEDVGPDMAVDWGAAVYAGTLLKNQALPGVIFSPKQPVADLDPVKVEAFLAEYERRYMGEGRGRPMVLQAPSDVHQLSWKPSDLTMKELRRIAEERVSAALNVPPIVAGLGVGLDHATYSNYEQAMAQLWQTCIIPLQRELAAKLTADLIPELGREGEWVEFDTSKIQALRDDEHKLHERVRADYESGILRHSEARERIGLAADAPFDHYRRPVNVTAIAPGTPVDEQPGGAPEPLRLVSGVTMKQLPAGDPAAAEDAGARAFADEFMRARYRALVDPEVIDAEEEAS